MLARMIQKKKNKRKLKQENEVFYSIKTILLHLVSHCKSSKLTRQQFTTFVTEIDPTLKYNAFYCIWRVYPGLINVDRIKKDCQLNPLACYFKLRKKEDEYDEMYDRLLDGFPSGI